MRIGSSTDKKDSGKIHVDFAQARDDLYEWECKQRLLAREERHRRKIQEDRLRPPSPPPIVHYSEHEAALLAERLKGGNSTEWKRTHFVKFTMSHWTRGLDQVRLRSRFSLSSEAR